MARAKKGTPAPGAPRAEETRLVVRVGSAEHAIPLSSVREVLEGAALHRVPASDPALRGVALIRGELAPVLHLGRLLGVTDAEAADARLVVVADPATGRPVGLLADEVVGFRSGAFDPGAPATLDLAAILGGRRGTIA